METLEEKAARAVGVQRLGSAFSMWTALVW
jgi:hypothetical protein